MWKAKVVGRSASGIGDANVNKVTRDFCSRNSTTNRAKTTTRAARAREACAHHTIRSVFWGDVAAGLTPALPVPSWPWRPVLLPADQGTAPGHAGADARDQHEVAA